MSRFDRQFDWIERVHARSLKRMFWFVPLMAVLNLVLGLGGLAAAVFIVLGGLRWFGVI